MKNHAKNSNEAIRIEAYLLSENAGHPHGMEAIFWARAEASVHARLTGNPAPKTAGVKQAAAIKKPVAKTAADKVPAAEKKTAAPSLTTAKAPAVKKSAAAKTPAAKQSAPVPVKATPRRKGTQGPGTLPV